MKEIDLEGLTIEQLVNLNKQVISKIKDLRNKEALKHASLFKIGDIVSFGNEGEKKEGLVINIRQKAVSVLSTDQSRWTVSPQLLSKAEKPSKAILNLSQQLFSFALTKPLQKR